MKRLVSVHLHRSDRFLFVSVGIFKLFIRITVNLE